MNNQSDKKTSNIALAFTTILFWGIIIIVGYNYFFKNSVSLKKISDEFNNLSEVKECKETEACLLESRVEKNKIIITEGYFQSEEKYEYEYKLSGNILTTSTKEDDLMSALITFYLVQAIGKLNGLDEEDVLDTLMDPRVQKYKISDGIEMSEKDGIVTIKINAKKPIKIIDFSK